MKLFPIITIISSTILLQGCLGTAIIASAAIATKTAMDPRSIGRQVDDEILEARVSTTINKDQDITRNARIIITAYEGKILLTGQVSDLRIAERAKQIAIKVEGVKFVYNEVRQATPVGFWIAFKDTLVTIKIKSQIFTNDLLKSSTVKVITEAGEVFLFGILTKQEGNTVAKIASETNGVKRVITAFTYLK